MDSLIGISEWVSDSCESAWLVIPRELRIRITDVLSPHHVGSAYVKAIRTTSRRLANHCRIRANPLGLRIHANCESASQIKSGVYAVVGVVLIQLESIRGGARRPSRN